MKTMITASQNYYQNEHSDLIEGCKKGDQKAQFQIYKLYYKAMYNTSLRIVMDPMEAEDIIQESFLSAFDELENYSGTVSFGAWLKKIVYNRSVDSFRKSNRIMFEGIESAELLHDEDNENVAAHEASEFNIKRMMNTLSGLPEKCRDIISLYFLEGYDHQEISEILSISESTSRSQLSRAKVRLKILFSEKYGA